MGVPDVLAQLTAAGIRLSPRPGGRIWAGPRAALNDELRELIRGHKAELLRAIARRERVLAMLAANPTATYAVLTDTQVDPEAVILALAIRGKAACELRIPLAKWDGVLFLDLVDRHGGTVH